MPIDGNAIQGKVWKGFGIASRKVGVPHDHYRPFGPGNPLAFINYDDTHMAAFDARPSYAFSNPAIHGDALRYALIDGALIQVGDYLVGPQETVFVAAMPPLQPIVCVACNTVVTLRRVTAPGGFGPIDAPTGSAGSVETDIITGWPASMLYAGRGGGDDMTVPGDAPPASFMLLLPAVPDVEPPRSGDVVVDDRNRRFSVSWFESSHVGWRMNVRILTVD